MKGQETVQGEHGLLTQCECGGTMLTRCCNRHDNDRKIPRTPSEIYELNGAMADKMYKSFHRKGIPVVPSLGVLRKMSHIRILPWFNLQAIMTFGVGQIRII